MPSGGCILSVGGYGAHEFNGNAITSSNAMNLNSIEMELGIQTFI